MPRRSPSDGQAVIACIRTVGVSSAEASVDHALALRARLGLAKIPIPGVGRLAYAKDAEGNVSGMMQNDPNAR